MNTLKPSLEPVRYHSFLLRFWQEEGGKASPWRIVLVDLQSNQRRGFTDFESLGEFVEGELVLQLLAALPRPQFEAENPTPTNLAEPDQESAG